MAEKRTASPQNSAFESGTLQDSAAWLFLNHIPKYGTFLLEMEMFLEGSLSSDHKIKTFQGWIYLSGLTKQ